MSGRWNQEYYIETIGPQVDIAFASCGDTPEEEIKKLCEALKARGCRMTVATRGGKGSLIYDGEQYYTQKPKLVDAVDTLGAGDSFATAFLLAMLEKKDIQNKRKISYMSEPAAGRISGIPPCCRGYSFLFDLPF